MEKEGYLPNPVATLIERGRATEQLIRQVVKRRNQSLFTENASEEQSLRLLNLLERVFETEDEVTQFLDLAHELYCQHLSQHLLSLKQ